MRIWKIGDPAREFCAACNRLADTTFTLRVMRRDGSGAIVPDVLVSVCDSCGALVSVPYQSRPRLAPAKQAQSRKLEARIPRHLEDALNVAAQELGAPPGILTPLLLQYYLVETASSERFAGWVRRLASGDLATGAKDCRLSLRLSDAQWSTLADALAASGLRNRSALLQGLIAAAWHDVIQGKSARRRADLARLASLLR